MSLINQIKKLYIETKKGNTIFKLNCIPNNIYDFNIYISGPKETPYVGNNFSLNIKIPDDYPNSPPNIRFQTKMFHVNVDKDGNICLDVLRDGWMHNMQLIDIIEEIYNLLKYPNTYSPLNDELYRYYKTNGYRKYLISIRDNTKIYGIKNSDEYLSDEEINKL